jgi:hypothetical protein
VVVRRSSEIGPHLSGRLRVAFGSPSGRLRMYRAIVPPAAGSERALIYWIIFGALAAIIIGYRFRPGGKYREMAQRHDRCASCRASLKWSGGQYAEVCPKCGAAQER